MSDKTSAFMLQVNEHNLPAVRAAVEESLDELSVLIARGNDEAFIKTPWMGDQVSLDTMNHFNMSAESAMTALKAYQTELTAILEQLSAMEAGYRSTEDDSAARMRGPRA